MNALKNWKQIINQYFTLQEDDTSDLISFTKNLIANLYDKKNKNFF